MAPAGQHAASQHAPAHSPPRGTRPTRLHTCIVTLLAVAIAAATTLQLNRVLSHPPIPGAAQHAALLHLRDEIAAEVRSEVGAQLAQLRTQLRAELAADPLLLSQRGGAADLASADKEQAQTQMLGQQQHKPPPPQQHQHAHDSHLSSSSERTTDVHDPHSPQQHQQHHQHQHPPQQHHQSQQAKPRPHSHQQQQHGPQYVTHGTAAAAQLAGSCHLAPHSDFDGDLILDGGHNVQPTAEACCASCRAHRGCNVFVWCQAAGGCGHQPHGSCWLKRQPGLDLGSVKGRQGPGVLTISGALHDATAAVASTGGSSSHAVATADGGGTAHAAGGVAAVHKTTTVAHEATSTHQQHPHHPPQPALGPPPKVTWAQEEAAARLGRVEGQELKALEAQVGAMDAAQAEQFRDALALAARLQAGHPDGVGSGGGGAAKH